jgi:hypothetical protein
MLLEGKAYSVHEEKLVQGGSNSLQFDLPLDNK